ncbi:hypothetical protein CFOL_v3_05072 [Cephalotus follicularis]|uniref:RING-type domain-containing protein n=1 Tax=Cephalotus follicularis TaxID=3775 RepID=A0A1Q3B0W0_CEPFO|nr:hypothetical protein CFOL_v3_05072 [Cephalotus follicularis]
MGSACCVAARDKTITNGPAGDILHRNIRYSPTWSFRWENRGRVAGEETSISWFSDGISLNDGSETKNDSAYTSEDGSPLESSRMVARQKLPISEGTGEHMRTPTSDQSFSRNVSMDVSLEQVKESAESQAVSFPSPSKLSLSLPSASSLSTSPFSSQSHLHPAISNTPSWPPRSPEQQLSRQVSNCRIPGLKSPRPAMPTCSDESTRGSCGGSSDGWSMHAFSELMASSHRQRWSLDSESFGFNRDKLSRSNTRFSTSLSDDIQTCGVCSKLLTEKLFLGSQKIIACSELSVVSVLTCGHVYHAECLENMTSEIDKYDPACPVCTLGEKQAHKLSEKALKAEIELKAKNGKKSRNRVVDSGDSIVSNRLKGTVHEGKVPWEKTFLRRHFSIGSKGSKSISENNPTRKKGFFWSKSSKM